MALGDAIELISDSVVSAGRRGVPLVGMKLDYDLTILDTQSRQLCGVGLRERGWRGPVLDAVVLDRHHDRYRKGSRTLGALCAHYGVCIENAHDAAADADRFGPGDTRRWPRASRSWEPPIRSPSMRRRSTGTASGPKATTIGGSKVE